MMALSWLIMITKSRSYSSNARANAAFMDHFRETAGAPLDPAESGRVPEDVRAQSSLWRLYEVAVDEMHRRHQLGYDMNAVSDATISAIRASMDGAMVREVERMGARMNWLSTTIEGAPYVGLFGTVIGIMLVFVVAAMAGAVDINSVAPGMAAALLCTAAGLGVAIPALFGYNWLASRSEGSPPTWRSSSTSSPRARRKSRAKAAACLICSGPDGGGPWHTQDDSAPRSGPAASTSRPSSTCCSWCWSSSS